MTYNDNKWTVLYFRNGLNKIVLEEVYKIHDHTGKDRKDILTPEEIKEITEGIEGYEQDRADQERAEADDITYELNSEQ